MMNREQALRFAKSSAAMAHDQRDAYADAIASFRENIIDTFADEGADETDQRDALALYDEEVRHLFAPADAAPADPRTSRRLSLVEAQRRMIERMNGCHPGHRNRVQRAAARELRHYLASIGIVDKAGQQAIVLDAIQVANLERDCDE